MKQQIYYPSTIGEQIQWLIHFQNEFPAVAARLALAPSVIASTLHDIEWVLYGLRGLRAPLEHLTKAVTAFNKALQSGAGAEPMILPSLIFSRGTGQPVAAAGRVEAVVQGRAGPQALARL